MRALRCRNSSVFLDLNVPQPSLAKNETLLRVRLAGICRTDLEIVKGYMKFAGTLGHEFVGEIDSPLSTLPQGTRVVGEINAGCGECPSCRRGLERHCPYRTVLGIWKRDGCLADWCTLPIRNLYPVPESVSDVEAVFVEPLAAVLEIFEQIHIEPTQRICIVGDGKLGLLTAMAVSQRHEGDTLLIGHHSAKMSVVRDLMETWRESELSQSINKTWDIVIETSGSTSGLKLAMLLVRPRGTVVLKSTQAHPETLDLTPLVIDEITVVGSRCGRFEPALHWLAQKRIPVERLVGGIYALDQYQEAWLSAQVPESKKVLFRIN